MIFCTRYGQYECTYSLLQELAAEEPLSPASFSVSVHNAAVGQFSIFEGLTGHSTVISSGPATLESAFVDCAAMLATGEAGEALLVYHDEPLPEVYGHTAPQKAPEGLALGLLMRRAGQGGAELELTWRPDEARPSEMAGERFSCAIDGAANVVLLLAGRTRSYERADGRLLWTWNYHAAA